MDQARLYLPALQAYCRAGGMAVTLKRNHEIFTFTGHEVRCRYLSDQSAAVDPRLVFSLDEGIVYVERDDLQLLGDTGEFRVQEVRKDGSLATAMRNLAWEQMLGEVAAALGPDAVTRRPEGTVREILEAYGACEPEALARAEAAREQGETLGEALLKTGTLGHEALLEALIGSPYLYRPPHHGPLALGKALREAGKITPEALAQAIAAEAQRGKPLRQTLVESRACHFADLESVVIPEIKLPPADQPGEILVRLGKISHSDLLHYLLQSVKQDRDLLDLLVDEGKVSRDDAHEAVRRHDLKRQIRRDGRVRLGEILAMRGRVTQDQVLAAVLGQMERADSRPLGQLLVEQGLVPPEEIAAGLLAQDERIEALVDKELKGPEPQEHARGTGRFRRGAAEGAVAGAPAGARAGAPAGARAGARAGAGAGAGAGAAGPGHGEHGPKKRRKLPPGAIGMALAAAALLGSAGYIAYQLGPGKPKVQKTEAPSPSLGFMTGGQANGDLDDAFLTVADVKRSARKPGATGGTAGENPVYREEIADLEQYVEAQQTEMAKMQKVAKMAKAMAPMAGSGEGGQLTMADLSKMASRMETRASVASGTGARVASGTGAGVAEASARDPGERPGAPASSHHHVDAPNGSKLPGTMRKRLTVYPKPSKGPVPPDGALNTQALLDIANGSYQSARDALAEAVKLEPDNPVTLFNLALCDYHLGQHAKALAELARARVQLEAGSANLMRLAGPAIGHRVPLATGSASASAAVIQDQAPQSIKALIRVTTLLTDTVTYQGHVREALEQKDLASRHYKEALPLHRRKAALQTALADLYRADGALGEASKAYLAAAKMDPRYAAPWLGLHDLALAQKQDALAARYLAVYKRLASGSPSR